MKNYIDFDENKCDVWALGSLLYYLVTNKYPYSGKNQKEVVEKFRKP